jgi:hypothetical protein
MKFLAWSRAFGRPTTGAELIVFSAAAHAPMYAAHAPMYEVGLGIRG